MVFYALYDFFYAFTVYLSRPVRTVFTPCEMTVSLRMFHIAAQE